MIKFIVIIFSLSFMIACKKQEHQSATSNSSFRLITYNVWYGFTRVPERKELWIQWMKEQQPDVVLLQELNEYSPEKLAEDARNWNHKYTVLLKEEGFPTGITSHYPIMDVQRYLKGFHHGLMRVKIRDIYFYVIHLHPSNWEIRGREIDHILADIKELPQEASIILAGDFNTFSPVDSTYYAHGRLEPFFGDRDEQFNEKNLKDGKLDYSVLEKLQDNGFADLEYQFRTNEYLFTGSFPTLIEKEGDHGDQRRLDYVFVSKNLVDQVVSVKIIANDTTQILSDHLPVLVEFEIN